MIDSDNMVHLRLVKQKMLLSAVVFYKISLDRCLLKYHEIKLPLLVGQETIECYDDIWNCVDQIHCEDLSLPDGEWEKPCRKMNAVYDHVPEVLRAYLPQYGDSSAYSLYRTKEFNDADDFIATSDPDAITEY